MWTRHASRVGDGKFGAAVYLSPSNVNETKEPMAGADSNLRNSKRFQRFRNRLIRDIPRIPNDRASLSALESKGNSELLRIYMCWKLRQVAIRPRRVTGQSALKADYRATSVQPNIEAFIGAVEAGSDLNRYLSTKAHRHGYVMAADPEIADCRTWEDKDFLLNVLGCYHFHLGLHKEASGMMGRTDEVLFGAVSRDTFRILGLFNHSVFDWTVDDAMAPERERLWSIHDECRAEEVRSGAVILDGFGGLGITTAGTPVEMTTKAMRQMTLIRQIDHKLDDWKYVKSLLGEHPVPKKLKLEWHYNHLDFGLLNIPSGHFFCMMRGPN